MVAVGQGLEPGYGFIARSVVDEHDLVSQTGTGHSIDDLLVQGLDIVLLVKDRNHNRDLWFR